MSARPYRFSIALQKGREHKKYEIQNTADRIQKISKAADPTRIADEVWYAGYQGTSVPMLMVSSTFKSVTKLFGFHSPDHMLRYIDLYKPNLNRVKVLENRLFKERSVRDLRKIVLSYAEVCGIERASLGFNVPRSTVVAWKAHQTRGTYEAA